MYLLVKKIVFEFITLTVLTVFIFTIIDTFNLIGPKNLFSLKEITLYKYSLLLGTIKYAPSIFMISIFHQILILKSYINKTIISTCFFFSFIFFLFIIIENIYFNGASLPIDKNEILKNTINIVINSFVLTRSYKDNSIL